MSGSRNNNFFTALLALQIILVLYYFLYLFWRKGYGILYWRIWAPILILWALITNYQIDNYGHWPNISDYIGQAIIILIGIPITRLIGKFVEKLAEKKEWNDQLRNVRDEMREEEAIN